MAFVPLRTVVGTDEENSGFKPLREVPLGPAPQRNALAAGLSSGVDQLQGLGYSIVGGAADLVGADTARDWANEQARRNQIDASLVGRPDLERIEDQSLSSALPYMGYQIAKQVPIIAGITAAQFVPGAGQAAGALGLTRLGAMAPRVLGGGGLEAGASMAARRAALAQGEALATGTMAGSALGFGSLYGESVEGGDPSAWKALALSPIYGAAEAVLPAVLQGSMRLPSRYSGNLATRMAKAGGVAGAGESLTELGQNELEMGMRSDLTPEEISSRRLNAAAAGFLVGGGLGTVGGFRGRATAPTGLDTQQLDLMSGQTQEQFTRPEDSQFKTADQMVGLQTFINQNTGVTRQKRKDYEAQFKAAFDEPSGQFVTDPATGIERQLSVGEYQQMQSGTLDLTQPNPADNAAANTVVKNLERDPRSYELRDTFGVIPTPSSLQLYSEIQASGIPVDAPVLQSVWKYAAERSLTPKRFEKAQQLLDAAIIQARKEASSGTGISTVQQPTGGLGVGGAVVPGTVGATGSDATIQGTVGGDTTAAGAPPQQAGVLPSTSGQPSTVVDQGQTTRGAPGTTNLVDTSDDALEIARATGNAAEIEAMRQDQEGGRADQLDFGNNEMEAVIDQHLAKSKNKERDRKILQAYILARKSVPEGYKGNVAQEVADTFGIDASRVRQIGNPELLANIAEDMGFDRNQVFTHLGIDSAQKAASTELGKLENDLAKLEAKASPSKADIAKMSELSEKIDQVKGNIESGDLTSALKNLGLEGEAGEMFASLDDSREWQKASTAGSQMAVKLVNIADKIAELQAAAAELKQLGLAQAEAAATERINALTADYTALTESITAPKAERKQTKAEKKTEAAQKAAEEKDAAKAAEAEKLRAEAAAKRAADRKGLEVGDTVVNPKLGTGVVKSFSGDGDATIVTVDFQSGQTKELSVKMAKLEKTNAVQVQGTAVVPVQPETQAGQGVGGQVRRTEKPAGKGQTQGQAKGQVDRGRALWESLSDKTPGLVPYEQLTKLEQDYLTDLAVRTNGKPVVAKEMGLQQLLTKEPTTIDVEARVIDDQVTAQVAALPAPQIDRLEKHYGDKRDSAEFLRKVQEDITKYVTQGAEAVAGAIRSIIKTMAEGVLAMGIVFNPNITKDAFNIDVGKTFQQTIEVTQEVPAAAKAQMSPTAQTVYSAMAPVAMKSGKWFMVADKPNGMLHIFKEDGSHALSDPTLYGKDTGDVLDAVSSLEGGPKITPAGKFTLKARASTYAGGQELILVESKDYTGYIVVHAADTSTPSENRLGRLDTPTAADNRVSYGCINTKHDTFINEIKPNISKLDGGMVFVVPDAQDQVAQMFAAETRTETRTEGGEGAKGVAAATVVGKEENMLFGKDGKAKKPYTAKQLLAELKDFIRADIPGRKLMVVNTIDDLLNDPDPKVREVGEAIQKENAYGVATDGRAYLIADRINQGSGRAKFMHEVGAHLGLENLLTKQTYNKLIQQLQNWAKKKDGSIESVLAQRATKRFESAGTAEGQQNNELLAYFLEEAIDAGIDPTATSKESGPLMDWFRTLWAAFKIAARKLGFKPESLTAQDVVNLAFGAARLEINGTWHGTAAAFRRFNHDFMGTGEGAQAYGWGSYFAQSVGIAKGYWSADVERKTVTTKAKALYDGVAIGRASPEQNAATVPVYKLMFERGLTAAEAIKEASADLERYIAKKKTVLESAKRTLAEKLASSKPSGPEQGYVDVLTSTIETSSEDLAAIKSLDPAKFSVTPETTVAPKGSLMRVDIPIADEDVLNWDEPLSKQPAILAKIEASISDILREDLEDQVGADLADMTGDEFYRGLGFVEVRTGAVSEEFDVEDYNKRLANTGFKEIVSKYLDEKLGIPALKFLDQNSRGNQFQTQIKLQQLQEVLREKELAVEKATKEADKWESLQDKAPPEQKQYARKTWLNAVDARTAAEFQAEQVRQDVERLKRKVIRLGNPTRNIVVFNDQNIFRVGSQAAADRQQMQFGKNAPNQGVINRNINKLPQQLRQPATNIVGGLGDIMGRGLDYVVFTSDLVARATKAGLPAERFAKALANRTAAASERERRIEKIADMYATIEDEHKGRGPGTVNDFLLESTRQAKWGYDSGSLKADPAMAAMFNALKPKAQAFVKAVFQHGNTMLSEKKQTVLNSATSEYDALIAIAKQAGDTKTETELKTEKANTLERFKTLFKIREGLPYAPIKRTGPWAVVSRSDEYVAAINAKDTKRIKELEKDPEHYQVSFVDSKWEARNLEAKIGEEFPGLSTGIIKRAEAMDKFNSEALLPALTKLRATVDANEGTANAKVYNLISQLYLETLAEDSARKSEMRRRGISGEVDMLQSFTTQGRADANFLASIEFSPEIQESLQAMRKESKKGDVTRRTELFDELSTRYVESLNYNVTPWVEKLTNLSSKYFLATSPGYYIQNLTQPFMMSVPAMAGRHDYNKVGTALWTAYSELGPLFKNTKLFGQQFDFTQVPDDVREAIDTLVKRGSIDIGLATEINEYKVEADGKLSQSAQRINKAMRLAIQKTEAINRLSTAMAAYRLELARTKGNKQAAIEYAAGILQDTHGDYTSMNAPRIFNSNFGKIALQFRKFQLVQIGFYVKLLNDIRDPKERKAALRTLGFSLAHTGIFAGAMGLPGYAAVAALAGFFLGDEDEPFDLTEWMRKELGPEWSQLVMRGTPTLIGVDLSGKIGAGNMLSIAPFADLDLTTQAGVAQAIGTIAGGAAGGMTARMVDGLGLMANGDIYRGLEQTMPKGISDMLKAGRIAGEGLTRRNGDVILSAEDVSQVGQVFAAMGLPSAKVAETYQARQSALDLEKNFTERSTKIKNQFAKAYREQDSEGMAKARESWKNLQEARRRNDLKPQPLSSLLRAPQEQRKRETKIAEQID